MAGEIIVPWESSSYKYLEYGEMRTKLQSLAEHYPGLM
jgi:hypothetical protein